MCWGGGQGGEAEGKKKKKNVAEWQREKTITNRMSPRKWSLVNKGEMELIFQTCIKYLFGVGGGGGSGVRKRAKSEQSESSETICR